MRVKLQLVMCNDQGDEETVVSLQPAADSHHLKPGQIPSL